MNKLLISLFTAFTSLAAVYYSIEFINTHAVLTGICALLYISATIFNVATCRNLFRN